jgi:hypothetical protein
MYNLQNNRGNAELRTLHGRLPGWRMQWKYCDDGSDCDDEK